LTRRTAFFAEAAFSFTVLILALMASYFSGEASFNFFLRFKRRLLTLSCTSKAFLSYGSLTFKSFCVIATILAESLPDLFPSTFTVNNLTSCLTAASFFDAEASFALMAAFFSGGA